jgi:Transposase domain (DUF772)
MMGTKGGDQDRLFYSFNLDKHVPADHLLRGTDHFLDLSELRRHLEPFYSHTGRPSVDPELMIRMLLVGYCFGIRSERRLYSNQHCRSYACSWPILPLRAGSTNGLRALYPVKTRGIDAQRCEFNDRSM